MEDWLKQLGSNPWYVFISLVGTIASVVAIPIAFFFFFKQKKEKKPVYAKRSVTLVENLSSKIDRIKVLYNDIPVENLTITKIAFGNEGKETILQNDIPKKDCLEITSTTGVLILDAQIVYERNPANNFKLKVIKEGKSYQLGFEYLDFNEIVILQFIHTGKRDNDITIEGVIKGVGKIKEKKVLVSERQAEKLVTTIYSVISLVLIGISFSVLTLFNIKDFNPTYLLIFLFVCTVIATTIGVFYAQKAYFRHKIDFDFIDRDSN